MILVTITKKGTDLWTSLTSWHPQGLTEDGRCHQKCGHDQGEVTVDPVTGHFRHFFALSVEHWRAKQGKGSGAMCNAMPPVLLQEVLRVAQTGAPAHQDVVIDICAGDRTEVYCNRPFKPVCIMWGWIFVLTRRFAADPEFPPLSILCSLFYFSPLSFHFIWIPWNQ